MAYSLVHLAPTAITRPNDTNAYAVGDVIAPATATPSALITFTNASGTSAAANFRLIGLQVTTDQIACQAQLRLHLFSGTPSNASRVGDNVLFPFINADKLLSLGWIDLGSFTNGPSGSDIAETFLRNLSFPVISDSSGNVYGILTTMTVFTPALVQVFQVQADFERY